MSAQLSYVRGFLVIALPQVSREYTVEGLVCKQYNNPPSFGEGAAPAQPPLPEPLADNTSANAINSIKKALTRQAAGAILIT